MRIRLPLSGFFKKPSQKKTEEKKAAVEDPMGLETGTVDDGVRDPESGLDGAGVNNNEDSSENEKPAGLRKRSLFVVVGLLVFFFVIMAAGSVFLKKVGRQVSKEPTTRVSSPAPPPARRLQPQAEDPLLARAAEKELEKRKKEGAVFSADFGPETPKSGIGSRKEVTEKQQSSGKTAEGAPSRPPILERQGPARPAVVSERKMRLEAERERVWQYVLNMEFSDSKIIKWKQKKTNNKEKPGVTAVSEESPAATVASGVAEQKGRGGASTAGTAFLKAEPFCFIPARVEIPSSTQSTLFFARTTSTACGVPAGTLLAGRIGLAPDGWRARVKFFQAKLPDGRLVGFSGAAYMMDETEGIGSVVRRYDRVKTLFTTVTKSLSDFFKTWRQDQKDSECVYTDHGIVCTSKQAANRFAEALKEGGSSLFDSLSEKTAQELPDHPIVFIEKGLPIKVLVLPGGVR